MEMKIILFLLFISISLNGFSQQKFKGEVYGGNPSSINDKVTTFYGIIEGIDTQTAEYTAEILYKMLTNRDKSRWLTLDKIKPNIFIGSDSTGRELIKKHPEAMYNIIIHDNRTGRWMPSEYVFYVDYNNWWVQNYLTADELYDISILKDAHTALKTSLLLPEIIDQMRQAIFWNAWYIIQNAYERRRYELIGRNPIFWAKFKTLTF